jgi:hypothetical protein
MGKSKKRNRTKALYEAAAAAKRRRMKALPDSSGGAFPEDSETIEAWDSRKSSSQAAGTIPAPGGGPLEERPSPSDIATTLKTIRHLVRFPDLFLHSKDYKELRGALHPLIKERLQSYDKGVDYRQKVTLHLFHKRWSAALSALEATKDFGQIPKQGTVQRWVRDADQCGNDLVKIRLLTAILGCKNSNSSSGGSSGGDFDCEDPKHHSAVATNIMVNKHDPTLALIEAQKGLKQTKQDGISESVGERADSNELKILDGWRIPASSSSSSSSSPNDQSEDKSGLEEVQTLESRIVYRETAAERTPPNQHDLLLHATEPCAVLPLRNTKADTQTVSKHLVPFVKGAFCLKDVLSASECARLVQAASHLGYRPDHPTHLEAPTGIDSCEWLVDDSIHNQIYDRIREHLPCSMGDSSSHGNKTNRLCGINRRWRFFRYGQNCVYRPHIDGSWPAGYLSEDGKSYEVDTSGRTRSYMTFLIYLNDNFVGGETRFYNPNSVTGGLVARGIVPKRGSVLVFPQGNTASLLHEGSAVTEGTKYVVRTDVLYEHE